MRKVYCLMLYILLVFCLTVSVNAATLHLFEPALTTEDEFRSEEQEFPVPQSVPEGWYPLRQAAEYLPFTVDWDSAGRTIIIDSDAVRMLRPSSAVQRYKPSRVRAMSDALMIVNGVTYCSPRFLVQHLGGIGFVHNGEIWCYRKKPYTGMRLGMYIQKMSRSATSLAISTMAQRSHPWLLMRQCTSTHQAVSAGYCGFRGRGRAV